jgi:glutathione S-transferase
VKLHWSPRSPFVRKVVIVLHELGLAERVDHVRSVVASTKPHRDLMRDNPLSKIPTLVLDDGTAIYDSPVICEYLDLNFGTGTIVPREPAPRIDALRRQALGDGLLDLLLVWRGELMRPPALQSAVHIASYAERVPATLDRMRDETASYPGGRFDIGDVATGCALSYLDFRFATMNWRANREPLRSWHQQFLKRPSVVESPVVDEP